MPAPRAPHIVATPAPLGNESPATGATDPAPARGTFPAAARDLLLIAGFAFAARLGFLLVVHDTYDYDEFVALLLGRDWAHGAIPYRDFMFFHPPGILVLTRVLEPIFHAWWPLARVLMAMVDTATAVLVGVLGRELWGRRAGFAAAAVYALSPVALVSAVRVGQDPVITCLGVLGLFLLLRRSPRWVVPAGICLGLAVWVKYPAAYFLPIYVLAAPRRSSAALLTAAATFFILLVPFRADWHALYQQTVTFQRSRWLMDSGIRLQTTLLYWLAANAIAVIALVSYARSRALPRSIRFWRTSHVGTVAPVRPTPGGQEPQSLHTVSSLLVDATRRETSDAPQGSSGVPVWVMAGFLFGIVFGFNSQVYYHYFVVVVPFAALLGGRLLATLSRLAARALLAAGPVLALGWGLLLQFGGSAPLYVTAAHLSSIQPTISLLERLHPTHGRILADRFEYAYLADRPAVYQYFWNVGVLVGPEFLERHLHDVSAIVLSYGASSGFPAGFERYLDQHYHRIETPANTVWVTSGYAGRYTDEK